MKAGEGVKGLMGVKTAKEQFLQPQPPSRLSERPQQKLRHERVHPSLLPATSWPWGGGVWRAEAACTDGLPASLRACEVSSVLGVGKGEWVWESSWEQEASFFYVLCEGYRVFPGKTGSMEEEDLMVTRDCNGRCVGRR